MSENLKYSPGELNWWQENTWTIMCSLFGRGARKKLQSNHFGKWRVTVRENGKDVVKYMGMNGIEAQRIYNEL